MWKQRFNYTSLCLENIVIIQIVICALLERIDFNNMNTTKDTEEAGSANTNKQ